jgi:hypothetical protein
MMMATPKRMGRATSWAASRIRSQGIERVVVVGQLEAADGVLHHDDGAVDDHAEVDRAEGHKVGGNAKDAHANEANQHGEGNDGGDEEGGADVAQKEEEDKDDQASAFEEILADSADGGLDDFGLIVEGDEFDALGEAECGEARFNALNNPHAVLTLEHDGHAGDGFALAIASDRALAGKGAETHAGDIAEQHGGTLAGEEDNALDVGDVADTAQSSHVVLFGTMFDEAAAEVLIVVANAFEDLAEAEAIAAECGGFDDDLILPRLAAPGVDFVDTADGAQLVLDSPLMESLHLHGGERAVESVLVDLAEGRGDGAELRFDVLGDAAADFLEPFVDQLAGEVGVDVIVEDDGDHREAELGYGAIPFGARQAHEGGFNRVSDQGFDFRRSHGRALGDDGDLVVGEVREGVDRNLGEGVETGRDDSGQTDQHRPAVLEVEVD